MQLELSKEFTFEAAHVLPKHPGKCSQLHGHSWVLKVSVAGEIDPETGFVMDYADIKKAVQPIIDSLDHKTLGQWVDEERQSSIPLDPRFHSTSHAVFGLPETFYPSSENLIIWIADQLGNLMWSKLELNETCTSRCTLIRKDYDDWKAGQR